jgi:hypothetical protein
MAVAALIRERQSRAVLLDARPLGAEYQLATDVLDASVDDHQLPSEDAGRGLQLKIPFEDDAERLADHEPAIRRDAHPAVDLEPQADSRQELAIAGRAQRAQCKQDAGRFAE